MHALDKASPVLMTKCATGEHIKEATLISRKAGKGQQEYLIIKMNDILVTSVQPSGSSEHPMESVSLQFVEDRPRVQAAEGRRIARRRAVLQVRHQAEQGRLDEPGPASPRQALLPSR